MQFKVIYMREEYEFKGAVRGKHHKAMHEGYTVHIHQADGTTQVRNYALTNGTVFIHPDVRKYFPDSDAVNSALRSLIALMEAIPHREEIDVHKKLRNAPDVQ